MEIKVQPKSGKDIFGLGYLLYILLPFTGQAHPLLLFYYYYYFEVYKTM